MDAELYERLWSKVPLSDDGCWEFQGAKHRQGYGILSYKGVPINTHRVSLAFFHGPIPQGQCVLHKCDNPPCVNPDHLMIGTQADNIRDMLSKGRHHAGSCPGELNGRSKLSREDVKEIKELRHKKHLLYREIAAAYNVSISAVANAISRKSWRTS